MTKPSVVAQGLGKKFGLSLRAALKYGLLDSCRRSLGLGKDERLRTEEFWALQDISFSLEPGDSLGIMGVNGSGKTTLLRILNGTYSPDAGTVYMRGQIGALIAAGAGFSPMLTGRENVFISGSLLGMRRADIRKRFDEIVAFAELEEFIDMPVRNYSSGMSVRLGFAIAVMGTPNILLVDEVLAVGDIAFQKKCYERIEHLKKEGTTILLVSHSPGAIWAVCNKGITIHHGCSIGVTSVEDACRAYETNSFRTRQHAYNNTSKISTAVVPRDYSGSRGGTGTAAITHVDVLNEFGEKVTEVLYGKSFILRYHFWTKAHISKCLLRVLIDSEVNKAIAIIDNYELMGKFIDISAGEHVIDILVKTPNLRPGLYTFSAALIDKNVGVHLFFEQNHANIVIAHPSDVFLYADFRSSVQLNAEYLNASWNI